MKERDKTKEQPVAEKRVAGPQMPETQHERKEREVHEALEYSESIINTVREPLIVLDQDLRVLTASRAFYEFFKVRPEETLGQFIYDLGNKQWDTPRLRELLETILPQRINFDNYEVEHDFATIGRRTMLLNARQVQRALGKERVILLAIEDITERKRLENLLEEAEGSYRHVFESASDGIVLFEKSEGKITHANQAVEKMLGYSLEESVGKKLQDIGIVDIDDFRTLMQILDEVGLTHYSNVSLETKSGEYIDTDIYLANRSMLVQCNIRDVSQRKQAQETLRKSEEKFRNYIESAPDGVFVVDDTGRYLEVNESACRLTGYSREEIEKMYIQDLLAEESLEDGLAHFNKLIETGAATSDLWHEHKDGSKCCLTVDAVKLSEKRFLGFCKDITSRKLTEEELKQTLERLRKNLVGTIHAMSLTVEARDPYTSGHQGRVSSLARVIAREMGLPDDTVDTIRMAGTIHDIGKISIPAEILSKPGRLTDIEFSLIKVHPQSGYDIIKDTELPYPIAEIVFQHHERLDGSGYPRGLKDGQILLESQIISVADVVEAMASHRPYRSALGIDAALEEIEKNKGILYDAVVVDTCLKLFREKGFSFESTVS